MGSRQLVVFGLVLVCVGLSDARVLGSREPTYRRHEAQKPAEVARQRAEPERGHSRPSAEPARGLQVQVYPELEPLTWSFPVDPVDPVDPPPARFEPRRPDRTERVAVRCGERALQVEVSQDLLGRGLVDPERVTLGGCPVSEVDHQAHVLIFQSDLHDCGSTLVMTDSAFIYAFALVYEPAAQSRSAVITRSQGAVVGVECHYPR